MEMRDGVVRGGSAKAAGRAEAVSAWWDGGEVSEERR